MDIVTIAAIAVLIYTVIGAVIKLTLIAIYLHFVKAYLYSGNPSVDSDQFNPNLHTS